MKPAAIVFMLSVWAVVISLVVFCYYKVLSKGRRLDANKPSASGTGEDR